MSRISINIRVPRRADLSHNTKELFTMRMMFTLKVKLTIIVKVKVRNLFAELVAWKSQDPQTLVFVFAVNLL